jgi:hypothetical protein
MLFELRQYRVKPGQKDNWLKFFEEVIVPFQTARGMTILGSWTGEEEEDLFVWIRRFESEEDRQRLYAAVYESDEWKNDIGTKTGDMLDRGKMVITRLTPTPHATGQFVS